MFRRKKQIIFIALALLIVVFLVINKLFIFVINTQCTDKIGIIDSSLSRYYENIVFNNSANFTSDKKTHGDNMIEFTLKCQDKINLYYYDAQNQSGNIDTDSIIQGLDWMIEHSVTKVNISLSNPIKHDELQKWILEHKQIRVFASYSNNLNSYDYPAMYEGVIASGENNKINYKRNDVKYKSNTIVFVSKNFKSYTGNSYLSILSMLKEQ